MLLGDTENGGCQLLGLRCCTFSIVQLTIGQVWEIFRVPCRGLNSCQQGSSVTPNSVHLLLLYNAIMIRNGTYMRTASWRPCNAKAHVRLPPSRPCRLSSRRNAAEDPSWWTWCVMVLSLDWYMRVRSRSKPQPSHHINKCGEWRRPTSAIRENHKPSINQLGVGVRYPWERYFPLTGLYKLTTNQDFTHASVRSQCAASASHLWKRYLEVR